MLREVINFLDIDGVIKNHEDTRRSVGDDLLERLASLRLEPTELTAAVYSIPAQRPRFIVTQVTTLAHPAHDSGLGAGGAFGALIQVMAASHRCLQKMTVNSECVDCQDFT